MCQAERSLLNPGSTTLGGLRASQRENISSQGYCLEILLTKIIVLNTILCHLTVPKILAIQSFFKELT